LVSATFSSDFVVLTEQPSTVTRKLSEELCAFFVLHQFSKVALKDTGRTGCMKCTVRIPRPHLPKHCNDWFRFKSLEIGSAGVRSGLWQQGNLSDDFLIFENKTSLMFVMRLRQLPSSLAIGESIASLALKWNYSKQNNNIQIHVLWS
jgi:hypothetical protein